MIASLIENLNKIIKGLYPILLIGECWQQG